MSQRSSEKLTEVPSDILSEALAEGAPVHRHAFSSSNSESDVLTCALLRGTSLYQFSLNEQPPRTPEQLNWATYMMTLEALTHASHATVLGHDNRMDHDAVLSRRSSPRRRSGVASNLEHLAAETDSSESVIASLPYYDLSNYSRSLNTLNLLQSDESDPLIDPIQEPQHELSGRPALPHENSAAQASEKFNQVPQRFSQFITDQNNMLAAPTASSIHSAGARSRDISFSMVSQATIFSTRSNEGLRKRRMRSIRTTRAGIDREPDSSSSDSPTSSLSRKKAIRCKDGSKLYRLRLLLRKIALKMKNKLGQMRNFFVGSRKATSKVKTASDRPFFRRSKSQKRRNRMPQISAPIANPGLGDDAGALRVEELTEELKASAGFVTPSDRLTEEKPDARNLTANMSLEHSHLNEPTLDSGITNSDSSAAPPPPPHTDISFQQSISRSNHRATVQSLWKQYLSNVLASRIQLRQEVQLFQLLLANQPIPPAFTKQPEITRTVRTEPSVDHVKSPGRWSESAGEIKSHRASIVPGKYTSTESEPDSFLATGSMARTPLATSPRRFVNTNPKIEILRAQEPPTDTFSFVGSESEDEVPDENIEKLQQVLNRRSMLGDMLDYDSDELDSSTGSTFSSDSLDASEESISGNKTADAIATDAEMIKRYGTLYKRSNDKSSYYGSSNEGSEYAGYSDVDSKIMSRSPGFNNLKLVSAGAHV
ncbi:hypothetical protein JCM33374_g916 [Metschnikowia sp. JCM 33374]|nr:hypothetical protein JCM33374_g916 [Metschnikowia sp. JCM 33374]